MQDLGSLDASAARLWPSGADSVHDSGFTDASAARKQRSGADFVHDFFLAWSELQTLLGVATQLALSR